MIFITALPLATLTIPTLLIGLPLAVLTGLTLLASLTLLSITALLIGLPLAVLTLLAITALLIGLSSLTSLSLLPCLLPGLRLLASLIALTLQFHFSLMTALRSAITHLPLCVLGSLLNGRGSLYAVCLRVAALTRACAIRCTALRITLPIVLLIAELAGAVAITAPPVSHLGVLEVTACGKSDCDSGAIRVPLGGLNCVSQAAIHLRQSLGCPQKVPG